MTRTLVRIMVLVIKLGTELASVTVQQLVIKEKIVTKVRLRRNSIYEYNMKKVCKVKNVNVSLMVA